MGFPVEQDAGLRKKRTKSLTGGGKVDRIKNAVEKDPREERERRQYIVL
ncbi:MAG: hypothetical protein AB1611_21605 [bacterium]